MEERIEGLYAVHSIQQLGTLQSLASGGTSSAAAGSLADHPEAEHPLVLTHPVTGARSLLLGPMVIRGIVGMTTAEESGTMLNELLEHATSTRYVYTHQWRQGDLVVWDNLATLHTASPATASATTGCCIAPPSINASPSPARSRRRNHPRLDSAEESDATPRVCP